MLQASQTVMTTVETVIISTTVRPCTDRQCLNTHTQAQHSFTPCSPSFCQPTQQLYSTRVLHQSRHFSLCHAVKLQTSWTVFSHVTSDVHTVSSCPRVTVAKLLLVSALSSVDVDSWRLSTNWRLRSGFSTANQTPISLIADQHGKMIFDQARRCFSIANQYLIVDQISRQFDSPLFANQLVDCRSTMADVQSFFNFSTL